MVLKVAVLSAELEREKSKVHALKLEVEKLKVSFYIIWLSHISTDNF